MKPTKSSISKIEVIIEKNDGVLWGRVENMGDHLLTPYGESTNEVIKNLKELVRDYLAHEGKKDKFWNRVDINKVDFEFSYDLQAFFAEHDYLKISSVAEYAGLNAGLLRQYASGVKFPSQDQAKKIEDAIHYIGEELREISIYA
ncbi:MAG TPA: hypothetical protein VKQ52_18880 [Puia sp.]|nr:hypothetical protein [Puia sp.]